MEKTAHNTVHPTNPFMWSFYPSPFTGKERDEETGYGYFGARYMDHELTTMWLSVDPMADKYPGISPYAYCVWNPVKLVDPDGERPIPLIDNYKGWIVRVDSWFGPRNISVKRASKFHKGLDFNYSGGGDTDRGAPILATHGGVASVDTDPRGGEGRSVTITALNNKIRTRYFHLQSINVSDGDNVSESDNIATMGGSGFGNDNAYSSHLHYEIQINLDGDWISIDPTLGLDDDLNNIVDPQRIIDSKELDCSITLKEVKIIDNKTSINE